MLIIGASGFIGSYLATEAEKNSLGYMGTARNEICSKNVHFDLKTDRIKDIIDEIVRDGKLKVAVICAAISKIDYCKANFEESYFINVTTTKQLIDELDEYGFKIVFLSTDNVFDGEKGHYSEEDEVHPINEYGCQKREIEKYLISRNKNHLVLRLSKVVGHNRFEPHPFDEWFELATQKKEICCIKGNIFSPTYIIDVARGILRSIEQDLVGIYHLCNNEYFSRYDLAMKFIDYFGFHSSVCEKDLTDFRFLDNRPLKTNMCGDKFKYATGFGFTPMKTVMSEMKARIGK